MRAGFWRRLAALGYDLLLLLGIWWTITSLYIAGGHFLLGAQQITASGRVATGPLLQILLLASTLIFFCYFWMRSGQTLGMQSWQLRLEDCRGAPLRLRQCLLRCAAACLSIACLGAGYWWILFDRDKCSWHDRLSGTRVVRIN